MKVVVEDCSKPCLQSNGTQVTNGPSKCNSLDQEEDAIESTQISTGPMQYHPVNQQADVLDCNNTQLSREPTKYTAVHQQDDGVDSGIVQVTDGPTATSGPQETPLMSDSAATCQEEEQGDRETWEQNNGVPAGETTNEYMLTAEDTVNTTTPILTDSHRSENRNPLAINTAL